jgi:hypothetical protein
VANNPETVGGRSKSRLPVLLWRFAFSLMGVAAALAWLTGFVYGRALDTVPNLGFLWGRVADMTWEYARFAVFTVVLIVLNARLTVGDIIYSTAVMVAVVLAFILAGSALDMALRKALA